MKRCSRCRQEKQPTTDYFYECARHKDGLQYYCIDCSREYCRMHKARVKRMRKAMWHGRYDPIDLEALAAKVQAEHRAALVKPRRKPEKVSPNVALLLDQLGVPRFASR